jgi:DNA topoisomerase-1
VLKGRFGPYVTDGKVNATIPKKIDPKDVTLEQAKEMIAEKIKKGPAKRRGGKTTKKAAPKKKTAAKKKPVKKK